MAIHIDLPTLLKIREGIRVNLNMTASHSIEYDQPITQIKPDIQKQFNDGSLKRHLTAEDYEEIGKADIISFWFVGGNSLVYRVGKEISQEDFEQIKSTLQTIEFRKRDDREPSTSEADKTA